MANIRRAQRQEKNTVKTCRMEGPAGVMVRTKEAAVPAGLPGGMSVRLDSDVLSSGASLASHDFELNGVAFLKNFEARMVDAGIVYEYVLALIRGQKTVAFSAVKPPYFSNGHSESSKNKTGKSIILRDSQRKTSL